MKLTNRFLASFSLLWVGIALAEAPADSAPLMADVLIEKMTPHLISSTGEKSTATLKGKDYVLVYWSASWCGSCRRLTPSLVKYYNEQGGGDSFEMVLICLDKSEEKMMQYMRDYKMPWPAVTYAEKRGTGAKSFAKGGIPRLMIINKDGEVVDRGNGFTMFRKFIELVAEDA